MVNFKQFSAVMATVAGVTVASAAVVAPAQAASVGCTVDTSAFLFGEDPTFNGPNNATDCNVSSYTRGNDSASEINGDDFFDINTWALQGKSDGGPGTAFFSTAGGKTGTFDFSTLGINFSTTNVMLTFKGANAMPIVGYLVSDAIGSWTTPFTEPFKGNFKEKDVSHISIFTSAKPTSSSTEAVPEPLTILGTLAAGGIGYGMKRRRDAQMAENA